MLLKRGDKMKVCPVCGAEYNDSRCLTCGYQGT